MTGEVSIIKRTQTYDLYSDFGGVVLNGAAKSLLSWPSTKEVTSVDYKEESGARYDLSELHLQAKSVSLPMCFDTKSHMQSFVEAVNGEPCLYVFNMIGGYSETMRFVSMGAVTFSEGFIMVTMNFSVDEPRLEYNGNPRRTICPATGLTIEGTDLSNYSVRLLKGTRNNIMGGVTYKSMLSRNISTIDGVIYAKNRVADVSQWTPRLEDRDITLNCLIHEESYELFYRCFRGLFSLVATEKYKTPATNNYKKDFYYDRLACGCYYKSMSVKDFFPDNGKVWCEFSLTLRLMYQ